MGFSEKENQHVSFCFVWACGFPGLEKQDLLHLQAGTLSPDDASWLLSGGLAPAKDCGRKMCRGVSLEVVTNPASPGRCK